MTTANAPSKQPTAVLFVLALVGCSFDASKLRALAGRDAAWPADGWASQADIALPPVDGMPEASTVRGDSAALDWPVADLPESIEAGPSDVSYLIPESGLAEAPSPSDTAVERTGTVDLASGGGDGVLTDAAPDVPTDTVGTGGSPDAPTDTAGTGGSPDAPIGADGASTDAADVGTIDGNRGVDGGSDVLSRDGRAGGTDGGVGLGSWVKIAGSSPKHFYPGVAYDPVAQHAVLFGGNTTCAETVPTNATWEWDGTSWTAIALRGDVPSARSSLAMTFDRANGEAIVHGGWTPPNDFQPGTYAYNLSTHSWTSRGTSLASVEWYSLAYETDAQLVRMFGGANLVTFYRDVRSWNRTNQTWSSVAPTGPSARARHAWVYDQEHGRFVMFGGYFSWGGSAAYETWEYDPVLSSWQQTATAGTRPQGCDMPPPMVYDPARKVVVMYCYQNGGGTWEYDAGTHVWSKVVGANQVGATSGAVAFYDEERQAVLLVGGCSGGSLLDSTWRYVPSE